MAEPVNTLTYVPCSAILVKGPDPGWPMINSMNDNIKRDVECYFMLNHVIMIMPVWLKKIAGEYFKFY